MTKTNRPEPILFLDDHRGIYIPRDFAQSVKRECVSGVSEDDWIVLECPDDETYWDVWQDVCDNARVTDEHGTVYTLYQDGDLWLIPDGMAWSDDEEWFTWPIEDDEDPDVAYSQGFDCGNYGNAYESQSWGRWSRKNRFHEHSEPYREGMVLGFFSSYELDEINDEIMRDYVEMLRTKHNAHD